MTVEPLTFDIVKAICDETRSLWQMVEANPKFRTASNYVEYAALEKLHTLVVAIDADRKMIAEMTADLDNIMRQHLEAEHHCDDLEESVEELMVKNTALLARVAELTKALEPFAKLGAELGDGVMSSIIWKDDLRLDAKAYRDGVDYFITVGDLRRAAAVKEG